MIAALIGIGAANVFDLNADQIDLGQQELDRGNDLQTTLGDVEQETTPDRILSFIPSNIFLDMTGERPTSVIAVVIFSMIVGIAVLGLRRKDPEQAETFTKIINAIYAVVMRIVTLILLSYSIWHPCTYGEYCCKYKCSGDFGVRKVCAGFLCGTIGYVYHTFGISNYFWFKSINIFTKGISCFVICFYFTIKCRNNSIKYPSPEECAWR